MLMNITNYTLQSNALDNKFRVRGSRHGGRDDVAISSVTGSFTFVQDDVNLARRPE